MKEKLIEILKLKPDAADEQIVDAIRGLVADGTNAERTIVNLRKEFAAIRAASSNSRLSREQEKSVRARMHAAGLTYEKAVEVELAQAAHDASQKQTAKA